MRTKNRKATIANYYNMQGIQDRLYAESKDGKEFTELMELIAMPENIKLAYRTIKSNSGSNTAGTDKRTIDFLKNKTEEEYVRIIQAKLKNYHPKKVRRVEIPKPNGKVRPLGIPCIEDRIVQQCILQILEPICEAKFYDGSYGFRPNRNAENAIAETYRLVQRSHLQYVINVDIKGFFDNVNHRKLLRQLWTLGIRDTRLLQIIKTMLKAPILLPDGKVEYPTKGTPQGGILSPLLANVVLNELDWWIASQWKEFYNEMKNPPKSRCNNKGVRNLGHEYRALRKTNLKEMYIVRYADDFKIFCSTRSDAVKIQHAVTQWLSERLKLQVSEEKTGITNLKRHYCEFLGFKIKLQTKGKKQVVDARMSDKAVKKEKENLKNQIKLIQRPNDSKQLYQRVNKYNSMVMGIQNYYCIANNVCKDLNNIQFAVNRAMRNRLKTPRRNNKKKRKPEEHKFNNEYLRKRYGKSKQIRWYNDMPLVPIGYCKSRNPMNKRANINQYTPEGRAVLYKPPDVDISVMRYIMENPIRNRSIEYNDNRISLYIGQKGKCAVSGQTLEVGEMHCHHKLPRNKGGKDNYQNLVFVTEDVHKLIHATNPNTILLYLNKLNLDEKHLEKLNKLRVVAGLEKVKQQQERLLVNVYKEP